MKAFKNQFPFLLFFYDYIKNLSIISDFDYEVFQPTVPLTVHRRAEIHKESSDTLLRFYNYIEMSVVFYLNFRIPLLFVLKIHPRKSSRTPKCSNPKLISSSYERTSIPFNPPIFSISCSQKAECDITRLQWDAILRDKIRKCALPPGNRVPYLTFISKMWHEDSHSCMSLRRAGLFTSSKPFI